MDSSNDPPPGGKRTMFGYAAPTNPEPSQGAQQGQAQQRPPEQAQGQQGQPPGQQQQQQQQQQQGPYSGQPRQQEQQQQGPYAGQPHQQQGQAHQGHHPSYGAPRKSRMGLYLVLFVLAAGAAGAAFFLTQKNGDDAAGDGAFAGAESADSLAQEGLAALTKGDAQGALRLTGGTSSMGSMLDCEETPNWDGLGMDIPFKREAFRLEGKTLTVESLSEEGSPRVMAVGDEMMPGCKLKKEVKVVTFAISIAGDESLGKPTMVASLVDGRWFLGAFTGFEVGLDSERSAKLATLEEEWAQDLAKRNEKAAEGDAGTSGDTGAPGQDGGEAEGVDAGADVVPTVIDKISPKNVLALASVFNSSKYKSVGSGVFNSDEGQLLLVRSPFKIGSDRHVLVLWQFVDTDPEYIHGLLLHGKRGEWKPQWVKPKWIKVTGDAEAAPEHLKLPLLQLAKKRWALIYAPVNTGCGGEDCKPEDDFVKHTIYELSPTGPVVLGALKKSPRCATKLEEAGLGDSCLVSAEKGENRSSKDIITETKVAGAETKTQYVLRRGRFKVGKVTEVVAKVEEVAETEEVPEEVEAEAKTDPKAEPKTDPKAEPKTDPKAEPKTDPKVEPKTDPKAEPKTDPKAEAESEAKPKVKPAKKPVPKRLPSPSNQLE